MLSKYKHESHVILLKIMLPVFLNPWGSRQICKLTLTALHVILNFKTIYWLQSSPSSSTLVNGEKLNLCGLERKFNGGEDWSSHCGNLCRFLLEGKSSRCFEGFWKLLSKLYAIYQSYSYVNICYSKKKSDWW